MSEQQRIIEVLLGTASVLVSYLVLAKINLWLLPLSVLYAWFLAGWMAKRHIRKGKL